jgi:uncharacterized protein (TIGR03083 family)
VEVMTGRHSSDVAPDAGLAAYKAGSDALLGVGRRFSAADWERPSACTGWDAAALVGHVLCVARWHHDWLDRAESAELSLPWPASALSERNTAALHDLDVAGGPDRLDAFGAVTGRYADRLPPLWGLPFAYPGGVVTVGLHAALAAGEWHLHAWDLGRAIGIDHEPDASLVREVWVGLGRRIEPDGDPWRALLDASGRVIAG